MPTGQFYNFTVEEYENRTIKGNLVVIHVKNHKTRGLASVIVDQDLIYKIASSGTSRRRVETSNYYETAITPKDLTTGAKLFQ